MLEINEQESPTDVEDKVGIYWFVIINAKSKSVKNISIAYLFVTIF